MYTEESLKRFKNPRNAGLLKDYNGKGSSGDPGCSDVIELFVRFNNNKVIDAKFKVFGCPGAVSTSDVFIDMIKGKTIEEALKISEENISDALGGLPLSYMHCSNLPMEAFKEAVKSYQNGK